jgi:hypothetical protein
MPSKLLEGLLHDFNDLAVEARSSRSPGLTAHISGLFVATQHKDVKEKAEGAQVALRGLEGSHNFPGACRECSVCTARERGQNVHPCHE